MKKTIIYLGITLIAFSNFSFASNTNFIGNQKNTKYLKCISCSFSSSD